MKKKLSKSFALFLISFALLPLTIQAKIPPNTKTIKASSVSIDKNIALFESNYKIIVSAISMFQSTNNGNLPKSIKDISKSFQKTVLTTPKGAKYNLVTDSYKTTLTATYNDKKLEFIAEMNPELIIEENIKIIANSINEFYKKNKGELPKSKEDLLKYLPINIFNHPKDANYNVKITDTMESQIFVNYKENTSEYTTNFRADEKLFKSNYRCILAAVSLYQSETGGKNPSKLNDLTKYLDPTVLTTPKGADYKITKSGSNVIINATYNGINVNDIKDYDSGIDTQANESIFEANFRTILSSIYMYIATNGGQFPTSLEDLAVFFPNLDFIDSITPKGCEYKLIVNPDNTITLKGSYNGKELIREIN